MISGYHWLYFQTVYLLDDLLPWTAMNQSIPKAPRIQPGIPRAFDWSFAPYSGEFLTQNEASTVGYLTFVS